MDKKSLRARRWEADLKQFELAFLLGCSSTYLSLVENNRENPSQEFKKKQPKFLATRLRKFFTPPILQIKLNSPIKNLPSLWEDF